MPVNANKFCGSFGVNTKFGFAPSNADVDGDAVAPTTRLEILAENLKRIDAPIFGRGLAGTVNRRNVHYRQGQTLVVGGITAEIGPNELAPWVQAILGVTEGDTALEQFTPVPHDLTIEREKDCRVYRHCVVNQAVFRARSSVGNPDAQIFQMALSFVGVDEEAAVWPSELVLANDNRYYWITADSRLSLTPEGFDDQVDDPIDNEFPLLRFDLSIRNNLIPLMRNRLTPGCFRSVMRDVMVDVAVPLSESSGQRMIGSNDQHELVLDFHSGNLPAEADYYATAFRMPAVRRTDKTHSTSSPNEIAMRAEYKALQDGATSPLQIVNVAVDPDA